MLIYTTTNIQTINFISDHTYEAHYGQVVRFELDMIKVYAEKEK